MRKANFPTTALLASLLLLTYPPFVSCTPVAKPPKLSIYPLQLNFSITKGENTKNESVRILTVSNLGGGEIHWSSNGYSSWLSIQPGSGICGAENATVKTFLNTQTDTLEEGNYSTICRFSDISDATNYQDIAVNITIKPSLFNTYNDPLKRFSFKYPTHWTADRFDQDFKSIGGEVLFLKPKLTLWPSIMLVITENSQHLSNSNVEWLRNSHYRTLNTQFLTVTEIEYKRDFGVWDGYTSAFMTEDQAEPGLQSYQYESYYFKILPKYVYSLSIMCWSNGTKESFLTDEYQKPLKEIANSFIFY